ncbi:hypothetical protein PUN4_1150053 [Paraburkholderia unamae]|nr:hypothetical protein PUN4_1150053 [Paraburkholderia unamae]
MSREMVALGSPVRSASSRLPSIGSAGVNARRTCKPRARLMANWRSVESASGGAGKSGSPMRPARALSTPCVASAASVAPRRAAPVRAALFPVTDEVGVCICVAGRRGLLGMDELMVDKRLWVVKKISIVFRSAVRQLSLDAALAYCCWQTNFFWHEETRWSRPPSPTPRRPARSRACAFSTCPPWWRARSARRYAPISAPR